MTDKPQIKLSETVVLMDAAFLNFVIKDVKGYFEESLQRPLREIDLPVFATCLLLDAGVGEGEGEIQFLTVYDSHSPRLFHCSPADLAKELDGVAFQGVCGECSFASVASEEIVSRGELFTDLLSIVLNAKEVRRVVVVSFNEEYGDKVTEALNDAQAPNNAGGKELFQFRMTEPESPVNYRWDMLAFPVMHALGIRPDEL